VADCRRRHQPVGLDDAAAGPQSPAPDDAVIIYTPTIPGPAGTGSGVPIEYPEVSLDVAFELLTTATEPVTKWPRSGPDQQRIDVNACGTVHAGSAVRAGHDFLCAVKDPDRHVRLGFMAVDYLPWALTDGVQFTLSIHATSRPRKVPRIQHARDLLWLRTFAPGEFAGIWTEGIVKVG